MRLRRPEFETELESQQTERGTPFHARTGTVIADIAQISKIRSRRIVAEPDEQPAFRHITRPGGVDFVDWSGAIAAETKTQIAINRNERRKRFLIINPSTASGSLFLYFGPTSIPYEIVQGAAWDEAGSEIYIGDLFVSAETVGQRFGAFEGLPVNMNMDELRL